MKSSQMAKMDEEREMIDLVLELQGMIEILLLAMIRIDEEGFYDQLPHACHQLFRIRDDFDALVERLVGLASEVDL